jgi:hypothetical protein
MKLRRNEYCPVHHSRNCCGRELVLKPQRSRQLGVLASMIRTTRADTESCGLAAKYASS